MISNVTACQLYGMCADEALPAEDSILVASQYGLHVMTRDEWVRYGRLCAVGRAELQWPVCGKDLAAGERAEPAFKEVGA